MQMLFLTLRHKKSPTFTCGGVLIFCINKILETILVTAKVQKNLHIEHEMQKKIAISTNFIALVAQKSWQVIREIVVFFTFFPLPAAAVSLLFLTTHTSSAKKRADEVGLQPPPPYARERLARLAKAEYVGLLHLCHGVSFEQAHTNGGGHPRLGVSR